MSPIDEKNFHYLIEPTLDELLRDPIVHLVMRRDGINEDTVRRFVREAALNLRSSETGTCQAA